MDKSKKALLTKQIQRLHQKSMARPGCQGGIVVGFGSAILAARMQGLLLQAEMTLPPGYALIDAEHGDGCHVTRNGRVLRSENRQPRHFASPGEAIKAAWSDYEQGQGHADS